MKNLELFGQFNRNPKTVSDSDTDAEFQNIRDQIVKQFFAEYDSTKLTKILNVLGCANLENCQTLIDVSNIEYDLSSLYSKYYIHRGEQINKKVIQSLNVTIENNSTSKQEFETPLQSFTGTQNFQVNISKTGYASSKTSISIPFTCDGSLSFTFYKNDTETKDKNQTTVFYAFPQSIPLNPLEKINVTYNFYQYEEFNYYYLEFVISSTSNISHPDVDSDNNVFFTKTSLNTFLAAHTDFRQNLKYKNSTVIRFINFSGNSTFGLKNFPAIERIRNFNVDVEFGEPEDIYEPLE